MCNVTFPYAFCECESSTVKAQILEPLPDQGPKLNQITADGHIADFSILTSRAAGAQVHASCTDLFYNRSQ